MISQRLADHRIWGDIPALVAHLSEIIFYEQREAPPQDSLRPLDEIRRLLPEDRRLFDVVAAAEDAAELAVGLALDGMANGIVLFQPTIDGIPEEMVPFDFSGLEERTRLFVPLVESVDEADAAEWRDLVAGVIDQFIGVHLSPQDAVLVRDVISDHAEEFRHGIQRMVAAHARGEQPPARAPGERWIDRLRELDVPVSIVSARPGWKAAEVLAARAPRGEAVLARGEDSIPWLADRDKAVAALTGMIERCS